MNRIFYLSFILIILASMTLHSQVTKTWDGGGDGVRWSDGTNWNPDGIPTSGDNVLIDSNGARVSIIFPTTAVANTITIGGTDSCRLNIGGSHSNPLTIYQTSGAALNLNTGSYLNITNSIKYMSRMLISILFIQNFRK